MSYLQQNLYLGIDFFRTFGLSKDRFCESLSTASSFPYIKRSNTITNPHLSTELAKKLKGVTSAIPCYKTERLGRTLLICHLTYAAMTIFVITRPISNKIRTIAGNRNLRQFYIQTDRACYRRCGSSQIRGSYEFHQSLHLI